MQVQFLRPSLERLSSERELKEEKAAPAQTPPESLTQRVSAETDAVVSASEAKRPREEATRETPTRRTESQAEDAEIERRNRQRARDLNLGVRIGGRMIPTSTSAPTSITERNHSP